MSLAENLLNSLDETAYQNSRIAGIQPEEEHIIVGQDRTITVPNSLKTIAVKGDKDIETVTFDCVRYWDGHDLSTFAIYINYILPTAEEETTYIPKGITKFEDTFSFDWTIGREITSIEGSLKFWIVAKLTDDEGNLIKQWSSLQNSDCTIAAGGDKIYVPEKQTDQDVISQVISVSREAATRAEEAVNKSEEAVNKSEEAVTKAEELIDSTIISLEQTQVGEGDGGINVWTATFADGKTSNFVVKNGTKGANGANGIDGETPYIKNGYWWIGNTNTNVKAEGIDGEDGVGIVDITLTDTGYLVIYLSNGTSKSFFISAGGGGTGADGVVIEKIEIKDGNLWVYLTNGEVSDLGQVVGEKGEKGDTGEVDYSRLSSYLPLAGGTMTGEIKIGQGDGCGIQLGKDGRINATTSEGSTTATMFGLISGSAIFGHSSFNTDLRGKASNPTYNGANIALQSEVPSTTEVWTFTLEDGSTVTKAVYVK